MPAIEGILETALYARDVKRTADFYRKLFNFSVLLESERLIALDVAGKSVLLIFAEGTTTNDFPTPGGVIPGHGSGGRSHFAFAIQATDVPAWKQHLASHGVPVESVVDWSAGATSIYFRDPDKNLAELITRGFWKIF